jgi:hypothetical protein
LQQDEYEDTEEHEDVGPLPMHFGDALGRLGKVNQVGLVGMVLFSGMIDGMFERALQGTSFFLLGILLSFIDAARVRVSWEAV